MEDYRLEDYRLEDYRLKDYRLEDYRLEDYQLEDIGWVGTKEKLKSLTTTQTSSTVGCE